MKRLYYSVGGIALVIAGWSYAWWTGREAMEAGMIAEIARQATAGIEISYDGIWIDGYPFQHKALIGDVVVSGATIGTLDLGAMTLERSFPGTGDIALFLPETALLTLPQDVPDEGAGAQTDPDTDTDGERAEQITLSIAMPGGRITVDPGEGAQLIVVDLPQLTIGAMPDEAGLDASLALTALTGRAILPDSTFADMADQERRLVLDVAEARLNARAGVPGPAVAGALGATTLSVAMARPQITARWTGPQPLSGPLTSTLTAGAVTLEGAGPALGGTVSIGLGTLGGTVDIEGVLGTIRATLDELTMAQTPSAASPRAISIDRIDIAYNNPIAAVAEPVDLQFRLSAGEIVPDEAGWDWLDPDNVLPRETGQIHVTLSGRAIPSTLPDPYLPLGGRIASVGIDVDMRGLGAAAAGTVEVQVAPDGATRGGGRITLDGSMGLVRDLIAASVLEISTAQFLLDLAARYARPGALPEDLIVDVESQDGQLIIGGEPVTLFSPLLSPEDVTIE
ncbi:MAG: DUF2125 domain-containing protein [Pseudomonadota bacterium]